MTGAPGRLGTSWPCTSPYRTSSSQRHHKRYTLPVRYWHPAPAPSHYCRVEPCPFDDLSPAAFGSSFQAGSWEAARAAGPAAAATSPGALAGAAGEGAQNLWDEGDGRPGGDGSSRATLPAGPFATQQVRCTALDAGITHSHDALAARQPRRLPPAVALFAQWPCMLKPHRGGACQNCSRPRSSP